MADLHFYASEAQQCRRKAAYRLINASEEEEFSTHNMISWAIGNALHDTVQDALQSLYPDFEREVRWELVSVTGRADGIYTHPEKGRTLVEIKTMAPRYFKAAVQSNVPQSEHMLQADMSALALGTEYVQIIYLQKVKDPKDVHEPVYFWHYRADLTAAKREVEEMQRVVRELREGVLPDREYNSEIITDPEKVVWPCKFCNFRKRCVQDGAGPIQLPMLEEGEG
jgi:CRISPR/Cas system-associated exonuclease Cas4 (RecB family)